MHSCTGRSTRGVSTGNTRSWRTSRAGLEASRRCVRQCARPPLCAEVSPWQTGRQLLECLSPDDCSYSWGGLIRPKAPTRVAQRRTSSREGTSDSAPDSTGSRSLAQSGRNHSGQSPGMRVCTKRACDTFGGPRFRGWQWRWLIELLTDGADRTVALNLVHAPLRMWLCASLAINVRARDAHATNMAWESYNAYRRVT